MLEKEEVMLERATKEFIETAEETEENFELAKECVFRLIEWLNSYTSHKASTKEMKFTFRRCDEQEPQIPKRGG